MGKLFVGILGGFSGTVGTVIGSCNRKGEDIIRVKSNKTRTSNTQGQVSQRTRFGLVTGFMQPLNPLLKFGFKMVAGTQMSPYNYACKYTLNKAMAGTEAQPELDYSKIIISDGGLSRISGATAIKEGDNIKFSWSEMVGNGIGTADDKVALLVYNVTNGEISHSMGDVLRSAKIATLPMPYNESDDQLLFYLFFQSASDPLQVSTSQYLGTVTVSE